MTAPERIWTASTNGKCHVGFDAPSLNYTNEYVRADLAAAMREAALREAVKSLRDWQNNLIQRLYPDSAITVGMAADVVEALIGENK